MSIKMLIAIFTSVFLAELGDKTQLAAFCFAADDQCPAWGVFLAASAALVCSTALAVLVGSQVSRLVNPQLVKVLAGAAFVLIGGYFIYTGLKA